MTTKKSDNWPFTDKGFQHLLDLSEQARNVAKPSEPKQEPRQDSERGPSSEEKMQKHRDLLALYKDVSKTPPAPKEEPPLSFECLQVYTGPGLPPKEHVQPLTMPWTPVSPEEHAETAAVIAHSNSLIATAKWLENHEHEQAKAEFYEKNNGIMKVVHKLNEEQRREQAWKECLRKR